MIKERKQEHGVLVVFFTYGNSLKTWKNAGILERELAIYKEHSRNGLEIHLITYGNHEDELLLDGYDWINVHFNHYALHPRLYYALIPLLHQKTLRKANWLKTNQLFGGGIAAVAASIFKKPLVARQGYSHYEHRLEEFGAESKNVKAALRQEKFIYKRSRWIVFTTKSMAEATVLRHSKIAEKCKVIPNYIVSENWKPLYQLDQRRKKRMFVYFGRFTEQKNLINVLDAIKMTNSEIILIGDGPKKNELVEKVNNEKIQCGFYERMDQTDLKVLMRDCSAFILASYYEGHPKSAIESMTFGIPCIFSLQVKNTLCLNGAEVGIFVRPSAKSIAKGIEKFSSLSLLQLRTIVQNARLTVEDKLDVKAVSSQERHLLQKIIAAN